MAYDTAIETTFDYKFMVRLSIGRSEQTKQNVIVLISEISLILTTGTDIHDFDHSTKQYICLYENCRDFR